MREMHGFHRRWSVTILRMCRSRRLFGGLFAIYATSERSPMPQHDCVSAVFLMCCRVGRLPPGQAVLFTLFTWLS
jgi:hypothetical protein